MAGPTVVAIVGCGPWGLAVLERLHTAALLDARVRLVVHVIEPGPPGVGIYSEKLPEYLLLNTACGQVDLFASKILDPELECAFARPSFFDWLEAQAYRVTQYRRPDGAEVTRGLQKADFLPRRWLGRYLRLVFDTLARHAPPNLELRVHPRRALDIAALPAGERIRFDDGTRLDADYVFLTLGHGESPLSHSELRETSSSGALETLEPASIEPGEPIGIAGFGLTAIDSITHLTVGKGGSFVRTERGLDYVASGREPRLLQFSRSGLPYEPRPQGPDEMARRPGSLAHDGAAIRHLIDARGQVDFRRDLLPLVLDEMAACFSHVAQTTKPSASALAAGSPAAGARRGGFDPAGDLFERERVFADSGAYQASLLDRIASGLDESRRGPARSPRKAGIESLRELRELVRAVVDFGGLTPESFADYRRHFVTNIYRLIVGPPVQKMEEWLALRRAGVVVTPVGPNPRVLARSGGWTLRSTRLERSAACEASRLLSGHASPAQSVIQGSALLQNLTAEGRVRALDPSGTLGCGLDLDACFHPRTQGSTARRLFVLGLLSEGARSFNLYVPSPGSRLRAFTDADACVSEIIGRPARR